MRIARLYQIVVVPYLITAGPFTGELAYATLKACDHEQCCRELRVYETQLQRTFDLLTDTITSARMMAKLRNGRKVEVPGVHSGQQLVKLGFRRTPHDFATDQADLNGGFSGYR